MKRKTLEKNKQRRDVDLRWRGNSEAIKKTAEEVLEKSSVKKPGNGKESWWWSPDFKEKTE